MRFASSVAAVLTLALAVPAQAGTLAGVTMPDSSEVAGQQLALNGMAVRSKLFIKGYVGGLYLPAKETAGAKILAADSPRQMRMHWLYGANKGQICEGWDEGLALNTPNASAELRQQFVTLCSWMSDVKKGEQFVFTYVPGTGTTVEVKGETKGTLAGKAFADALFACWIGAKPSAGGDFKEGVLGG